MEKKELKELLYLYFHLVFHSQVYMLHGKLVKKVHMEIIVMSKRKLIAHLMMRL